MSQAGKTPGMICTDIDLPAAALDLSGHTVQWQNHNEIREKIC
jgi:hypothetical protein